MSEELERRIADAFAAESRPGTPEGLKRVLQRRELGQKVELISESKPPNWIPALWVTGVAAALLLVIAVRRGSEKANPERAAVAQLAEAGLLPSVLMAQGAERPSFPVVEMNGPELKPGEWVYAGLKGGASFSDSVPRFRSRLARGEFNGKPAWLMLSRPSAGNWLDTTWVDLDSLNLLARSTSVLTGNGRITEEFRPHDVLKGFTSAGHTTWTVIANDSTSEVPPSGLVLQGDALFLALRRARLSADWHASFQMKSNPIYNRVVTRWYDLAVVGEERVAVPAGEFDCWKISLGAPSEFRPLGHIRMYVSKDRQWIIKQGIEGGTQRSFWSVLVSGKED